jgi:hypothetical protein
MNHRRGNDGSFVRLVVVTLLQSATDRQMLFCEPHHLMTTRAFGHNVTFGDRMTRRGLLKMGHTVLPGVATRNVTMVLETPNPSLNADARRRACARASVAG